MSRTQSEREQQSSAPEDIFAALFAEVFGLDKAQLLKPQHPVQDIYGNGRFIDFALRTASEQVAFEIDGLIWHVPDAERIQKYEDDLLRQNSLIHQNWRVFRFTDRQLADEPETIRDQLTLFLERIPGLLDFDDFLPRQLGRVVTLREHQFEALQELADFRTQGISISLLPQATGTGKTVTAIADARAVGGRTLFVVHTKDLVNQAVEQFRKLWPEVSVGRFMDSVHDTEQHVVVGTVQSLARHLSKFAPDTFAYLIVDEAHHAKAESYGQLLKYFRPMFTLGLTATEDRADGATALEVFRNAARRLTLREAVERGELVGIRCVRVETNINLNKVRFNEIQYNRRDLEEAIIVPGRDRLIVDTYREHIPGRKAVVFCVNVRHAESLADLFRAEDVAARSVSGRMNQRDREAVLRDFAEGQIRVLCACDLLNEGWDCPDVESLFMARPTLSKVIYLQQLGRGTRKAPGKEALLVFDFVDNASKYNAGLNLHSILGNSKYRRGALILGTPEEIKRDEDAVARGELPSVTLPASLWATDLREINVFNWQETVKGMVSSAELELQLGASEGRIREAAVQGRIVADHTLKLGERTYYYFNIARAEDIRTALDLPVINDTTIRGLFLEFVERMDMSASYKPVLLLSLLNRVDTTGRAKITDVAEEFASFYRSRRERGMVVERSTQRMAREDACTHEVARDVMLGMPFRKFEQKKFMSYDRSDLAFVRFAPPLWKQLTSEDITQLKQQCQDHIDEYFKRIAGL